MIYSLLLLITLNGFQTGARANTLPPQLRSPIVSNSTFRLPPQICLDLLGQAALTAPASEALEQLRQLTPESGFANGDHPASRYSRRSKAFLAGRNHLNASEKAILYRDFAERMARASKGTWTAAEYQAFNEHALSRDFVFVGAKQHYLAIRSSDGHVFEVMPFTFW